MPTIPPQTVSVLIAAYNAAAFVHRAIQSAINQTVPILEVIVVDDGSSDETSAVVERLAQNDPRIRLIALPVNGGPSVARNAGLDVVQGEWVAILDADDVFLLNRTERMLKAAFEENADIVMGNFAWYNPHKDTIGATGLAVIPDREAVDIYRFVSQARPYTTEMDWGLLQPMIKTKFLNDHRLRYPTYSRHGEDFLFTLNIFLAGAKGAVVRAPDYLYTERSSGFSRTKINYKAMAKHSEECLKLPAIQSDAQLKHLLQKRIRAIYRLDAEYWLQQYISDCKPVSIALLSLRSSAGLIAVLRRCWRRLKEFIKTTVTNRTTGHKTR